jgi:hypothetical protein
MCSIAEEEASASKIKMEAGPPEGCREWCRHKIIDKIELRPPYEDLGVFCCRVSLSNLFNSKYESLPKVLCTEYQESCTQLATTPYLQAPLATVK